MKILITTALLLSSLASYAACNLTISNEEQVLVDKVLRGTQSRTINEERNYVIENRWVAGVEFNGVQVQVQQNVDCYMDRSGSCDRTIELIVEKDGEISHSSADTKRSSLIVKKNIDGAQYEISLSCK